MTIITEGPPQVHPNPIHDLLRRRRSPRTFSPEPVESGTLQRLFEAARWAPSSSNEQPWRFVVATKDQPEDYTRFLGFIREGNRTWAQNAPVLILSVAKNFKDKDGEDNRHAFHDVGQAVAGLTLQALEEGLYVRQMGGFFPDKAREALNIPHGYDPVAVIALGALGDLEALPEDLREREMAARTRRSLSEIVFAGKWDHALSFDISHE